ncbi:ATP-grasp domain-containing protein [Syntrophotalea acetylenica]|uniref:ATP-grasp domain-containing protein n=1 Tax=Syntrophotalea acetylenica TaxID=29542 RepID=A0A1L3GEZ2_SYNAC|nr:ATP-grasp domain-containing protein [Syntrophotalea acetylenica]APG24493.1 ATP-grasp domain-containing protein [Syntrophotalea acetylenica]APG45079.1 ATP-grasp domain-containing protein [Syntrophotalea acetylenica]
MFFVDKPYVSEFVKETLLENALPVVATTVAKSLGLKDGTRFLAEDEAVEQARQGRVPLLYATSENCIGWIAEHLSFTGIPAKIELFKNKLKFREMTRPFFPEFYFREVLIEDLATVRFDDLPVPFIIKPAVGFFSMGVHKVASREEWTAAVAAIRSEIDRTRGLYPEEVLDSRAFIVEECIDGEEFAVDAYFDAAGAPVVLGIFQHVFASGYDVSDRVYITSKAIIEENLAAFSELLGQIGKVAGVRNFPVHAELRRTAAGRVVPIEVNPMRFGGWCTTADLTFRAYGLNPYLCYFSRQRPDWPRLLEGKAGKLFAIVVLDNGSGIEAKHIRSFDYDMLLARFEKPLELRKVDYHEYPVFGFLFTETAADNFAELEWILRSDLRPFIKTGPTDAHSNLKGNEEPT